MSVASHSSETPHSSAWHPSQQDRDTVFSVLQLLEVETFFNANVASMDTTYSPSNSQALQASVEIVQASNNETAIQLPQTSSVQLPVHAVTDTFPLSPVPAQELELIRHIQQTTPARTEAAPPTTTDTHLHAANAHHSPEAVAHHAAASSLTPNAQIQAQSFAPIDLAHLFQPEPSPLWSAVSGWGEINVSAALNHLVQHPLVADDSATNTPAHLKAMGFDTAWHNGFTGQGVIVADIDTGIDLTNQTLMNSLHLDASSWNFLNNSANIQDDNGHGTMTAMEIGASDSVGSNMEGGAYGTQVMVLKAMDANGQGHTQVIGEAIHYAVDHGAGVINLSLGSNSFDIDIQNAMQYAYDKGVIVVAAAGNGGSSAIDFPAAYGKVLSNVIAVGASDQVGQHDVLASFSNQAGSSSTYNFVDAIGTHITGYGLDSNLATWSGTSMASPLVAAEAAILKSANPQLSAYDIVQNILHTTNSLDDLLNQVSAANDHAQSTYAPIQTSSTSHAPVEGLSHYATADYLHASTSYVPTEQYY